MPTSEIKSRIEASVKDAMRAREKQRLGVLRLIMAEFKRVEVDERIELDDDRKTAMVSNLLVVLCAQENAQPVLNTGSLY